MLELPRGALKAERDGYSLHAATRIELGRRDALEHLLRDMARPPLCLGRLMLREDGKVIWNLLEPWRDGTRSFVFDPLRQEALRMERLVATALERERIGTPSLEQVVVATYPSAVHCFTNPDPTKKGEEFGLPLRDDTAADGASWEVMLKLFREGFGAR